MRRSISLRTVAAAAGAVALLSIASVPYSPGFVYEGRYLIFAFGHEMTNAPHWVVGYDSADGAELFGLSQLARDPLPGEDAPRWFKLGEGAWGPSHGPWSLLSTSYPAPYLAERHARVVGAAWDVRIWEGAGVQRDCYEAFDAAGLTFTSTTGGGQGWGPHGTPMGYPVSANRLYDAWDQTRWLTCVWMDPGAPPPIPPTPQWGPDDVRFMPDW